MRSLCSDGVRDEDEGRVVKLFGHCREKALAFGEASAGETPGCWVLAYAGSFDLDALSVRVLLCLCASHFPSSPFCEFCRRPLAALPV